MNRWHDIAAIISSGDELVVGQSLDTNARWIAEQSMLAGILPVEHVTVPDEQSQIVAALRRLAERVPLIVMTGGLGPTEGDLTRQALSEVLGEELVEDAGARATLEAMLKARGRELTPRQLRQAMRPRSARCLTNSVGTAPGLHAGLKAGDGRPVDIFCLPGPPGELRAMWESQVRPRLRPQPGRTVRTRLLHMVGIAESDAVTRLGELTRRDRQPLVGITASGGVLTLRIRWDGLGAASDAASAMDAAERAARDALGAHIFGIDGQSLAARVLQALRDRGKVLASVESCTGGLLGKVLTDVSGSSASYVGGTITYSNDLKTELVGVPVELILRHGAVSAEAAAAMARGGLERLGADECVGITGVAGPEGGSTEKPVGTVWIARASREGGGGMGGTSGATGGAARAAGASFCEARRFLIAGDREDVRARAVTNALAMVYFGLVEGAAAGPRRLLWEQERRAM